MVNITATKQETVAAASNDQSFGRWASSLKTRFRWALITR
jgi:hypothetical protein